VSPTLFREGGFRFYFFSREEVRAHVHVQSAEGEAKFWIEPKVELALSHGLNDRQLRRVQQIVEERRDEIRSAWNKHFGG
jgi:hypothetical protein